MVQVHKRRYGNASALEVRKQAIKDISARLPPILQIGSPRLDQPQQKISPPISAFGKKRSDNSSLL